MRTLVGIVGGEHGNHSWNAIRSRPGRASTRPELGPDRAARGPPSARRCVRGALEPNHRRVVITGYATLLHRVMLANFDEATGRLTLDERFRDEGATESGMRMDNKSWPHGGSYPGIPHGAVFSLTPATAAGR